MLNDSLKRVLNGKEEETENRREDEGEDENEAIEISSGNRKEQETLFCILLLEDAGLIPWRLSLQ